MRFPNATKGIKKIFLAEILMMISAVIIAIISMTAPAAVTVLEDGTEVAGVSTVYIVLMVCASILAIVGLVINIVGLNNAKSDDANFMNALVGAVLGIVISAVNAFVTNNDRLTRDLNFLLTIDQLMVSFYVMGGIISLATQLRDEATAKKAQTSRIWLICAYFVSAVMGLVVAILAQNGSGAVIAVGLANVVVQLVTYILFLRALIAGRSMLNNN